MQEEHKKFFRKELGGNANAANSMNRQDYEYVYLYEQLGLILLHMQLLILQKKFARLKTDSIWNQLN